MFAVWVSLAFGAAACWGLTVVVNKRALSMVDPIALNAILRVPTLLIMTVVVVPLTLTHAWNLEFAMNRAAAGYLVLAAVVTWLIAFNAYYLALRRGDVGVLSPIMGTDPVFTALFAVVILGAGMSGGLVGGLAVTTAGVVLLSRQVEREPPVGPDAPVVAPPVGAAPADTTTAGGRRPHRLLSSRPAVIGLAVAAAAGWGLGPVLIEQAQRALDGNSATMILLGQTIGLVLLCPIVLVRRRVLLRPLQPGEGRLLARLILISAVLEAAFAVSFYFLIDNIGAVLTVLIIATSPLFSILGGVVILRERYSRRLALGAALTLAGVAVAVLGGR